MTRRVAILITILIIVLCLPMVACGLSDDLPPDIDPTAAQHSIDTAACERACGGDVDCTHLCLIEGVR